LAYVDLNPLRAGTEKQPEKYQSPSKAFPECFP
jgi:hypothetical protein